MSEPSNEDRAGWGLLGLQTFTNRVFHHPGDRDLTSRESFEQALSDMLGDLMHAVEQAEGDGWEGLLADPPPDYVIREGEETIVEMFHRLVDRGASHFVEELAEERDEAVEIEGPCTFTWSTQMLRTVDHQCMHETGHLEVDVPHECAYCGERSDG